MSIAGAADAQKVAPAAKGGDRGINFGESPAKNDQRTH
jgi:hypothetical protein